MCFYIENRKYVNASSKTDQGTDLDMYQFTLIIDQAASMSLFLYCTHLLPPSWYCPSPEHTCHQDTSFPITLYYKNILPLPHTLTSHHLLSTTRLQVVHPSQGYLIINQPNRTDIKYLILLLFWEDKDFQKMTKSFLCEINLNQNGHFMSILNAILKLRHCYKLWGMLKQPVLILLLLPLLVFQNSSHMGRKICSKIKF